MSFDSIKMGRIPNSVKEKFFDQKMENGKIFFHFIYIYFILKLLKFLLKDISENLEEYKNNSKKPNNQNFILSVKKILKMNNLSHFYSTEPSNLLAKSLFIDSYINTSNENILFVLTLLRDKSYQLYKEHTREYDSQHESALGLANKGLKIKFSVNKEAVSQFWKKDLVFLSNHARSLIIHFKNIPGFNRMCAKDQSSTINDRLFTILLFYTSKLFINGEFYLMIAENIPINKEACLCIFGEYFTKQFFEFQIKLNSLCLTDHELALLVPFVLSIPCNFVF